MQVTFLGLLFCVLLTLKLTGTIAWSWLWVTAPLWMPAAVCLAIAVFALGMHVVVAAFGDKK